MKLWQDPRWLALAHESARLLGADTPAGVRAILAQWACEQGSDRAWPPALNNPGNLTSAIGGLDDVPHGVGRLIGGGAYLYHYTTPDLGAQGYAHYLLNSSRYGTALAAIRHGDPAGFLTAVCRAGYGTVLSCCLSTLPGVTLPAPAPTGGLWTCLGRVVNVRSGPGVQYPVVGSQHVGDHVTAVEVYGGMYAAGSKHYTSWLRIDAHHFTARAFYRAGQ